MSRQYRFHSQAFGEYLEYMAIGLIEEYIKYLNLYASCNNHLFHVGWILTGKYGNNRVYTIELYDDSKLDQVTNVIKQAYLRFFRTRGIDGYENVPDINIKISIKDYSWDKYNKTYLRTLNLDDTPYRDYHSDTVKFHIRR